MQLHGAVMAGRTGSRRSITPVVTNTRRLSSATCPRDRVDWSAESPARTVWLCTTSRKASPGCTGPARECGHMHAEGAGQRRDRRRGALHCEGRCCSAHQATALVQAARTLARRGSAQTQAAISTTRFSITSSTGSCSEAQGRTRRGSAPGLALCAALGARARRQVHAGTRAREHAAHPWPAVGHRQAQVRLERKRRRKKTAVEYSTLTFHISGRLKDRRGI